MQLEESRLNQASRLSQAMKERTTTTIKKMGRVRKVKEPREHIEISATQGLENYRYGMGYANKDGSGKGNCE